MLNLQVLNGVDLQIDAGESVALVGHSGCGKSTIISLLLRFYDADAGRITLDGTPLQKLNLHWLRNTIGVVSQEPILFDATIEENIKLGDDEITTADMVHACKIANCHEFIKNLPKVIVV